VELAFVCAPLTFLTGNHVWAVVPALPVAAVVDKNLTVLL
jgi:hypothetical protein